jgi:hypothetical protein
LLCYFLVHAKGGSPLPEKVEPTTDKYPAVARQPVKYGGLSLPTNSSIYPSNTYAQYDLDYYSGYYRQYASFINSEQYTAMKNQLNNDSLVCLNYDVSKNGTYMGAFTCPLPFEITDFLFCCGETNAEFCCHNEDNWFEDTMGIVALVLILGVIFGLGILAYCFFGLRES